MKKVMYEEREKLEKLYESERLIWIFYVNSYNESVHHRVESLEELKAEIELCQRNEWDWVATNRHFETAVISGESAQAEIINCEGRKILYAEGVYVDDETGLHIPEEEM